MELKIVAKKEYLLVFIAFIIAYFINLPKLEFLIYQNLNALLILLITSFLVLITSYLTRKLVHRALIQTTKLLRVKIGRFYTFNKKVVIRCLTLALEKSSIFYGKTALFSKTSFKRLADGTKDILDLREAVPKKESVTESLVKAHQEMRKKKFIYKVIGAILANTFIISFLIKGLKIESNSIIIPDYLEIQFLAYKTFILAYKDFILLGPKVFIAAQIISRYFTPQNISLVILTTSITYALSIKRFRETIKNLLLEACKATTIWTEKIGESVSKKVSEESKILQSDAKDVANKQTWLQVKKEASLFKEELSTWEAKRKLLALAAASFIIIIMISGSINHENNLWTSFVAASAGQSCTGAYAGERCDNSETCCNPYDKICSKTGSAGYYCYSAAGANADPAKCENTACNYDTDEGSCTAGWYCAAGTTNTACVNQGVTTFTPWTWGQAATVGYETGVNYADCCGDDASENYLTCNKEAEILWSCTALDKGCCAASTKCVDEFVLPSTVPSCYNAGVAYKVASVSAGNNDRFAYCPSIPGNTWYDCDSSSGYCNTYCANAATWPLQGGSGGASSWVIGGEGSAFGEYDTGTSTECCGDDINEFYTTSAYGTKCCNAEADCAADTCYSTTQCYKPAGHYYCDSGSFVDPDTSSTACTIGCSDLWYDAPTSLCCGDDVAGDAFYAVLTGGNPDVCMYCNGAAGNDSRECVGETGCTANGVMMSRDGTPCTEGPDCWCYAGEACASTGYTNATVQNQTLAVCDVGGINDDRNADCFDDRVGENGTCRYINSDPCTSIGFYYSFAYNCADEGNESFDGYYCYYDEGCDITGPHAGCTQGSRRPDCTGGGTMTASESDCREDNVNGTLDICHYKTGDACPAGDGGPEGGWDFTNDTGESKFGVTCVTCDSGYQEDNSTSQCHYATSCTALGWSNSTQDCFEWCWANDLTYNPCFGAQIAQNRTEPANATNSCYYSRTCTIDGCGSTSAVMRQDFCDQCEPTGRTDGEYCPNINASCSSNCENDGTIWYGTAANNITRCSNENTSCVIATDTLALGDIWTGNTPATCDNTECKLDCVASGKAGGVCISGNCACAPSVDCSNGCTIVMNSSENNVTIFSSEGNMFIAGDLLSSIGVPDGSDFIIKDNANANKAWINDINGSLGIAGWMFENNASSGYCTAAMAGTLSFMIKDKDENCVAFINSTGDVWLRGNLTQNAEI